MKNSNNTFIRTIVVLALMLAAGLSRLVPHPPNMTAVLALALFGGASFKKPSLAVLAPLVILVISDLFIGFYSLMPVVYCCVAFTSLVGIYIGKKRSAVFIAAGSVLSSTLFYFVTNAAVWYHDPMYVQNFSGLMLCYDAAIPFYRNQLFGDLFFNFLLFGSYKLARQKFPALAY